MLLYIAFLDFIIVDVVRGAYLLCSLPMVFFFSPTLSVAAQIALTGKLRWQQFCCCLAGSRFCSCFSASVSCQLALPHLEQVMLAPWCAELECQVLSAQKFLLVMSRY